ncbi:MAG: hypothetical protein AB7H97_22700 [Pseudobdellovibrionaceae bacterium]
MRILGVGLLFVTFSTHAGSFDDFMRAPVLRPSSSSRSSNCSSDVTHSSSRSDGLRSSKYSDAQIQRTRLYGAEITPEDYRAARGNMSEAANIASRRVSSDLAREGLQINPYSTKLEPYQPRSAHLPPLPSEEKLRERHLFGAEITPEDYKAAGGDMNAARIEAGKRTTRELAAHGLKQDRITGTLVPNTYESAPLPKLPPAEKQREYAMYGAEITSEDYREAGGNMSRAREIANKRIQDVYARHRVRLDPFTGTLIPLDDVRARRVLVLKSSGPDRHVDFPIMPEDFVQAKGDVNLAQRIADTREEKCIYSRMVTESDLRKYWRDGYEQDVYSILWRVKQSAYEREVVPGQSFADSRVFDPSITVRDMRRAQQRTSSFPDMLSFARAEATVRIANKKEPSEDQPLFDSKVTYDDLQDSARRGGDIVTILERAVEIAHSKR